MPDLQLDSIDKPVHFLPQSAQFLACLGRQHFLQLPHPAFRAAQLAFDAVGQQRGIRSKLYELIREEPGLY